MNIDLENLNRWLVANRLSLSVTKTEFMVIGSHQRISVSGNEEINVEINGKSITRVHKAKSLGLLIDKHLTWKDHVDEVVKKISKAIGALKDVRANCFCASLLRTQMHTPRHTRARALSNKMRNDRAKGHCYSFAWI